MKIIEKNNPIYKIKCEHCSSVLEFEEIDIQKYEGKIYWSTSILCPCCGHKMVLSMNGVPICKYEVVK